MLTITPTAAEALDAIVASVPDAPDTTGLRIGQGETPDGRPGLTLELTAAPGDGDQVVEAANTPVFVDGAIADELDDKILDAQIEGDQVGFTLGEA